MLHVNKVYEGSALDILRQLPSNSINMAITSPPYWSKRNYGLPPSVWGGVIDCDHIWMDAGKAPTKFARDKRGLTQGDYGGIVKCSDGVRKMRYAEGKFCNKCGAWSGQLGLEPRIDMFVNHLCDIFDELKRVLRDDGSFYLNIGDTYYGTGSGQKSTGKLSYLPKEVVDAQCRTGKFTARELPRKCKSMIPQRVALEMVNRGWILRNIIVWNKPNAVPESVKDRYTHDFEFIYFFSKKPKYYFEQQFEPYTSDFADFEHRSARDYENKYDAISDKMSSTGKLTQRGAKRNPKGRNKRATWFINTKHFKGAHFATFPEELVKTPILASCPPGGIVLDPFAGSGTALKVAYDSERKFVGIELNPDFIDIISKRLGFDVSIERGWEV